MELELTLGSLLLGGVLEGRDVGEQLLLQLALKHIECIYIGVFQNVAALEQRLKTVLKIHLSVIRLAFCWTYSSTAHLIDIARVGLV